MKAHKFLARGGAGPFSGFAWPLPAGKEAGAWITAEGRPEQCVRGIHVCREIDLAHWIHDELWEVEVDGPAVEGTDCLVVARARLVRPIESWTDGRHEFAQACLARASAVVPLAVGEVRDLLEDAKQMATYGMPALCAYTVAVAVARARVGVDLAGRFRDERAWQSAWIAGRASSGEPRS